jgi:hypothetical protein
MFVVNVMYIVELKYRRSAKLKREIHRADDIK